MTTREQTRSSALKLTRSDAVGWLTCYFILLLFIPSRLVVGPLGSAGAPSMLFGLGSLLLWSFLFLGAIRRTSSLAQPVRIALGIFLFCVGITYVLAMSGPMSPDEISPAAVALLSLASWAGTLLLTHDGIFTRARLNTLIWRFVLCGFLIAFLGLVQVATRQLWVDRISIPGLSSAPAYGLVTRGGFPRPAGTSIHPIEFGVLLSILLPIALHVGFFHTGRPAWMRWLPAATIGAIILALRICMAGWSRARRRRILAVGAGGALLMSVVTPNFLNSVIGLFTGAGDDPSIASRTGSFSLAFEFLERNPWFGRGLGTFLPKYRIFDNQYLLLLVTVGVVGTLAFLALGVTAIVTLLRLRARLQDVATRDLALALVAAVCAGFSCLFMFDAFAFPMTMGTLFVVLGVAGALRHIEGEN